MQMNPAQAANAYVADVADTAFDSVWGIAMQREDFLLLAAGVRQFSLGMTHLALVSNTQRPAAEQANEVAD